MNPQIITEHADIVAKSEFFDAEWYAQTYPDVVMLGQEPLQHFLSLGWRLGRNPSPQFNCALYLQLHQDVAAAGINPLVHYLLYGREEGRALKPQTTEDLLSFVNKQLKQPVLATATEPSLEQRLVTTQKQLEHYFLRCQELENELRLLKK